MSKYILGIDNGGTMAKAALFDPQGKQIALARRRVHLQMPQTGWREFDAEALWQATAEAIRQVVDQSGVQPAEIVAAACTGHGNGLYLVDASGRPTRPGISSSDSRARTFVEKWEADGTIDLLRPKTLQCNWPAQPNALLRWMVQNEPEVLFRSRWVLMCKDYIRMRLTGEAYAERTDFSGTSLMNVPAGQFDDEIFDAFGIGALRGLLPAIIGSTDPAGKVTAEAAALSGLAKGTAVYGGAFDVDACGLAAGCVDEENLVMVGGTWGCNQYLTRQPLRSADVFMVSRYAIDEYYLVLEGSATSASNLEWLVDQVLHAERARGGDVYALCSEMVAAMEPSERGPCFLPFLYACPVTPDATAALVGLTAKTDRAAIVRAVFEGVCFMHHWHYDRLMQFRDPPATITMTGGIARSDTWCQMFADVFNVPVQVPAAEELGALGAAMLAAVGQGIYGDLPTACQSMTGVARQHQPNTSRHAIYRSLYRRFLSIIEYFKPIWNHSV